MIKDENYYTIQGWMRTRLHLKGNDLHVYAMLYSFSQDGQSEFRGSLDYITDFTGGGLNTIKRSLERLEKNGLIKKEDYHSKTGRTNGFKCVPLEQVNIEKIGQDKMGYPIAQNGLPPQPKMGYPLAQNGPSLPYYNNTDIQQGIYNTNKKERKKLKKNHDYPVSENGGFDFQNFSEEELADWGEHNTLDFSDETSVEVFNRYLEETEKRAQTPRWVGKVIKEDGQYVRMKSHAELIKEHGVSIGLRESLYDWLRSCYANGHLVTNRQLEDTIFRLQDKYGDNEWLKIDVVRNAMERGYIQIVV